MCIRFALQAAFFFTYKVVQGCVHLQLLPKMRFVHRRSFTFIRSADTVKLGMEL